ncbi:hypothetical protein PIB30_059276 [Stylosanthes scabra]|uniref:Uncharacterized protein n=1 Tax=Stylosanthes scabra TaxID=79078 RepID=A0ABU6QKN4_9FABA|nr:hypothetical protein [Stylosanthes scabra]
MAEDRVSNSSTSTDDSTVTDKTQPSPSRAASMPLTSPISTPLQGNASSWVPRATRFTAIYQWMGAYARQCEDAPSGSQSRNNPVYTNPTPSTQHAPQGWYPPPPQGGNYGYSNNPQPSAGAYGIGGTPFNFGTYNPQAMYSSPQSSLNPVSTPVPQPSQAATTLPQLVSTRNNRTIFPEMSRQMPTSSSPANNTVESLAVFR